MPSAPSARARFLLNLVFNQARVLPFPAVVTSAFQQRGHAKRFPNFKAHRCRKGIKFA